MAEVFITGEPPEGVRIDARDVLSFSENNQMHGVIGGIEFKVTRKSVGNSIELNYTRVNREKGSE